MKFSWCPIEGERQRFAANIAIIVHRRELRIAQHRTFLSSIFSIMATPPTRVGQWLDDSKKTGNTLLMLKRRTNAQVLPLLLLVVYGLTLVTATHWPQISLPSVFKMQDKLLHLGCYAVLGLLAYWAFAAQGWLSISARSAALIMLAISIFGAVDEVTQYFAPGRVVDICDWIANTTGGVIGAVVYLQFAAIRKGLGTRRPSVC